jgi:hypothetical protein
MLHWAMPSVLLRHTAVAIEMAGRRGAFVRHRQLCHQQYNHSQRPCYGPLKLKLRHSDIYYNVISLLLCFGRPLTMMDAVSATIVAGGQANIN